MDNYGEIFDSYLMHSNRPGSHWYQHKYGKWQSQAVYAQGQPNPDAKVKSAKDGNIVDVAKLNDLAKQGIRDQSLTKDHVVPSGTVIYRGKDNKKEGLGGSKYVTYLDNDRDNYRYLKPGYEYTFKLNKDLKVAGRDKFIEAIDAATKNDDVKAEVVKNWIDYAYPKNSYIRFCISFDHDKKAPSIEKWNDFVNKSIDNYKSRPLDQRWFQTAQALANTPKVKDGIVDYLKKHGYDAFVDEAAVGGRNGFGREGIAPMLIFDSEKTLTPLKVKHTPDNIKKNAKKFAANINLYNSKDGEWSDKSDPYYAVSVFDELTDSYLMHYGTPDMHWRTQEPLFNRKASNMYVDKVLNRSMYGGYTRK